MNTTKTIYQQLIHCKKVGCKKCPHGPYWYACYRENGRMVHKYIGRVLKDEYLGEYERQTAKRARNREKM